VYDPSRGYPVVVPCLLYDDLPSAASWLVETLGFREILVLADPQGQRWLVTSHVRDTDPSDWYGTVLGPMPG
jgi:hypothetical protein